MDDKIKFLASFRKADRDAKLARWIPCEKAQVLVDIIKEVQPTCYFESGTANGYSTMHAAVALPDDGVVHTFDPANRFKIWTHKEFKSRDWQKIIKKINYHHTKFNQKPTDLSKEDRDYKAKYWPGVKDYLDVEGRRVFFIDGDHSYNGVLRDWRTIMDSLRDGDVIIFDDIATERKTLKAYLAILGNLPHTFVDYRVQRIWMDTKLVGTDRIRPDCLGVIHINRVRDIRAREKEMIKGVHYE